MAALGTDLALALNPTAMVRLARPGLEPDDWQIRVLRTRKKRVVLLCARQTGKSTVVSFRALHAALYSAPALVLVMGRALKQARELFSKIKSAYMELARRAPVCPVLRWSDDGIEFRNGSRVLCVASSADNLRGYSPDLVICDEAAFVRDAVFEVVRPMFAVTGGTLILLSTAGGRQGAFYEAFENGGPEWEKIRVRAEDCPRITPEFLEQERRDIGAQRFGMEYLVEWGDPVGAYFSAADIDALFSDEVTPLRMPWDEPEAAAV
jgi:hypothetical protein